MGNSKKALNGVDIGDELINYALFPSSPYGWWIPSGKWLLYRVLAPLFIMGVWSVFIFSLLNFIPLFFPVLLPAFLLPLLSVVASLFIYFLGDRLRALILKPYARVYRWALKFLFAKSQTEANDIVENLIEERSLAQQLMDYFNYFLNRPLRVDAEANKNLKIRISKFNARWGAMAKFILNSFFLITGTILFASTLLGLNLTPVAIIGIIIVGVFGGVCSSIAYSNVLGNSLIKLSKIEEKSDEALKEQLNLGRWVQKKIRAVFTGDFIGWLISIIHGFAGGVSCFSAGMHFVAMLSSFPLVAANPFVVPVLLVILGFCSLAIAKGFYALTYKVWREKKESLKGFFSGTGADGKPMGRFQRIFGILGALLVGVTISLAFVMLNGTSFATTVGVPIYSILGSVIQLNLSPAAFSAFIFTGVIGGIGTGIIFFCGCFKLFGDMGKWIDSKLASVHILKKETLDPTIEAQVMAELKNNFGYVEEKVNARSQIDFWSRMRAKHNHLEKVARSVLIIFFNGIGNAMLATVPNIILLVLISPSAALPVALILFSLTAFASMGKDYMNWVGGHENLSHAQIEIKNLLREAVCCERELSGITDAAKRDSQIAHIRVLRAKAKALKEGYDPHFYVLLSTGIVRVLSNVLAALLLPFSYIPSYQSKSIYTSVPLQESQIEPRGVGSGAEGMPSSTLPRELVGGSSVDASESTSLMPGAVLGT